MVSFTIPLSKQLKNDPETQLCYVHFQIKYDHTKIS